MKDQIARNRQCDLASGAFQQKRVRDLETILSLTSAMSASRAGLHKVTPASWQREIRGTRRVDDFLQLDDVAVRITTVGCP